MKRWIRALGLLAAYAVSSSAVAAVAGPGQHGLGSIAETGGSNYTFYDMGNAADGTQPWDATLRPVIGTYHLNPTAVQAQLQQLYDSGQRRISLVLWYMPFTTSPYPGSEPGMWAHIVNSQGGHLIPQHEQNLRAVLRWVKYVGFEEVTLRFAQQGGADASSGNAPWNAGWSETQYQENLAFIASTRAIMESVLAPTGVKRQYDLGVELGGITAYQAAAYTKRLWTDYVSRYGSADSYGFSYAAAPGRVAQQIAIYNQVGVRPYAYAIDAYAPPQGDPMDQVLGYVYQEMQQAGDGAKPVIIQETYANDGAVAQRILNALAQRPIKIKHIVQWPVASSNLNVNLTPSAQYNAYGGSSAPSGSILAQNCVLTTTHLCSAWINWTTSNASNVRVYANGALMAIAGSGSENVNWISGPNHFELTSDQGSLGTLDITALPAGTPTLDWLGAELSCDKFQCVTATGSNLQSGCTVGLFAPDWSSYLGAATNVACATNQVSFTIPGNIQQTYAGVNFNVTNPNGKWSEPVYVPIDPPKPVIYKAGLTCAQNQCVWASTTNVTAGCSVSIFAPDWSATLAVLTNVSCNRDAVAFEVPAWIRQQYSAINFNVNNAYSKWSEPYYVNIH